MFPSFSSLTLPFLLTLIYLRIQMSFEDTKAKSNCQLKGDDTIYGWSQKSSISWSNELLWLLTACYFKQGLKCEALFYSFAGTKCASAWKGGYGLKSVWIEHTLGESVWERWEDYACGKSMHWIKHFCSALSAEYNTYATLQHHSAII